MQKPRYTIRETLTFDNTRSAKNHLEALKQQVPFLKDNLEVSYYMPQPKYKAWVPRWLIKIITKK